MAVSIELQQLSAGVRTRAAAERCEAEMRPMRLRLERELREQQRLLREKEDDLHELLSDPLEAWDQDAHWQLAMCEYALCYDPDAAQRDGGRKMGVGFRAAALWALRRDQGEVVELPRFKGLYELHVLHLALRGSDRLRIALSKQLMRFKRLYCAFLSSFGRFKSLAPLPGETLLQIIERLHVAARKWRPRGNPGKEPAVLDVPQSIVKGVYQADWIVDSLEAYHTGAGKTLSLRGTVRVAKHFSRRYLKSIPEEQRPKHECPETLRLRDIQLHQIQRRKALENSFSRHVTAVQVCLAGAPRHHARPAITRAHRHPYLPSDLLSRRRFSCCACRSGTRFRSIRSRGR